MTGPTIALARAHRRYTCGTHAAPDRLDREDLEAALAMSRVLAAGGFEVRATSGEPVR